ncbi:MAG: hemin receptor [Bacteroidia bacterium]
MSIYLRIFTLATALVCYDLVQAQNERDALRHTQTGLTGTARALGMGGAFSAVGADLTSATLNPAGLGLFRSSVFAVSPAFQVATARTDMLDASQRETRQRFGIPSSGVAFNTINYYDNGREKSEIEKGLKSYTFAIGVNQLENYYRDLLVQGAFNPSSSLTNYFAEQAEGFQPGELGLLPGTAFDLLMIDTIYGSGGARYFPAVTNGQMEQTMQILEEGRRNEWYVALGGNFSDRFYLGAAIGLQTLRYEQTYLFVEEDVNNLYQFYNPFEDNGFPLEIPTNVIQLQEYFSTRGTGVNGKIGAIYRPLDHIRIGASVQTPTFLNLTDEFQTTLTHNFNATATQTEEATRATDLSRFEYSLATPFRATLGAMVQFQKYGFFSADVEFVDYTKPRLSSVVTNILDPNYYGFAAENQAIADLYQPALNYRLGGEYRIDIFRLRAGAALYGSPLGTRASEYIDPATLEVQQIDASRRFFTLGAGVRQPNFYMDVSFVNQVQQDKNAPYSLASTTLLAPTAVTARTTQQVMATMGFVF